MAGYDPADCTRCGVPLDLAAHLQHDLVCTDCRAAEVVGAESSEWALFLRALRDCVRDGLVRVNDVRPLVRGQIEPKHIGLLWRRARTLRLVDFHGWEPSTDEAGGNADKQARVYKALPALRQAAA